MDNPKSKLIDPPYRPVTLRPASGTWVLGIRCSAPSAGPLTEYDTVTAGLGVGNIACTYLGSSPRRRTAWHARRPRAATPVTNSADAGWRMLRAHVRGLAYSAGATPPCWRGAATFLSASALIKRSVSQKQGMAVHSQSRPEIKSQGTRPSLPVRRSSRPAVRSSCLAVDSVRPRRT